MQEARVYILVFVSILFVSSTFASDTTDSKKPVFFSISAGYTNSRVFGSLADKNKAFDPDLEMRNGGGYTIELRKLIQLSDRFYCKTGVSFINKRVNPQEATYTLYKDKLNTTYLSLPFLLGVDALPFANNRLNVSLEFGPSANFRIIDKTRIGPDRVSERTRFGTISLNSGVTLSCALNAKLRLMLNYNYVVDVTNSYVHRLYWTREEPNKKFAYKYQTHCLSIGLQWPLKR